MITSKHQYFFLCFLCSFAIAAPGQRRVDLSDRPLASHKNVVSFQASSRSLEIFRQIAESQQVVVGVSGTLVGSDRTLINISLSNGTIGDLLNTVVSKDPRYKWRDMPDGTIEVTVGGNPLDMLSTVVHNVDLERLPQSQLASKLANFQEIKTWLQSHSCNMGQIFLGRPPTEVWTIRPRASEESLREILNDIAVQTHTYFWTAIRFSENPCEINLHP